MESDEFTVGSTSWKLHAVIDMTLNGGDTRFGISLADVSADSGSGGKDDYGLYTNDIYGDWQITVPGCDACDSSAYGYGFSGNNPDGTWWIEIKHIEGDTTLVFYPSEADRTAGTNGIGLTTPHGSESGCLLYTSPSPRDKRQSRMPSSA